MVRSIAAYALLAATLACSEGFSPPPAVASVALSPGERIELVPAATQMLVATARNASGATIPDRIATWSSSDPSIATVAGGLVTGVALGSAVITASVEGRSASVDVAVKDGAVVTAAGRVISDASGRLVIDVPANAVSASLILTFAPASAPPASARTVAGSAFDMGPASAVFSQPVTVTIAYDPEIIPLGYSEWELQLYEVAGQSWRLVQGSLANTTDKRVSGSVTQLGTFAVMLKPTVERVTIAGDLTPMPVATTRQLVATPRDRDGLAMQRPVSWSSSDPDVLSVDTEGRITARIPGSARITAASDGVSADTLIAVTTGPPAKLVAFAGNNQVATVGGEVPTRPSVLVTDAADNPLAGVPVTFTVASGGGAVTGGTATTDASGIAAVGSWRLGVTAGSNTLTATSPAIAGATVTFQATASAVPVPSVIAAFAGNNQTARPGTQVGTPPAVLVRDTEGMPIAGVAVSFAVTEGGGSITGANATTNEAGIAAVGSWTLGPETGINRLSATSGTLSGSPVIFEASGEIPPAPKIEASDGSDTGIAGEFVPNPPSVLVTDPNGHPLPGVTVTWVIGLGDGLVVGSAGVTDFAGIGRVGGWRLGPQPGHQTLHAVAEGLVGSPVIFNVTALAPEAGSLEIVAGANQTARPGLAVATPPAVLVRSASGNPMAGIPVTFAVSGGGGSVTGANQTSNAQGIATVGGWTLGPSAGPNTLTVTAGGISVQIHATAANPGASSISIHAGNNQSAAAGHAVAVPPSVRVTDADGAPVPGVTVTFGVLSGGGSITGATPVTDGAGIATLGSWVLGSGSNSLSASAPGLAGSPLTFVAFGAANVQIVTFGDSNTDLGFAGTGFPAQVASYVSGGNPAIRLGPGDPHSSLQLAGKIEARWKANRSATIKVVNHGITGTATGSGRNAVSAPHALEQVGGVSRFRGEVLGDAYPWSGGESANDFFPNGPVSRTQAFVPRTSDFAYVSMGTNDIGTGVAPATIAGNLQAMADEWLSRGLPANRFFLTTIPPRSPGESASIPALNVAIKALALSKGVRLIDIAAFVSDDNGLTWRNGSFHVGDSLHYSESVRDWIATQVVDAMFALVP